jgi:hypothetical protein
VNTNKKQLLPETRFWDKVKKGGLDECWEWQGFTSKSGYGRFRYQSKREYAHRVAYILEYSPIRNGLHVCHKCDNPKCVNPNHLFLGTNNDNMRDKVKKGRQQRGERSGTSKLTEQQVLEILALKGKETQKFVGKKFGVVQTLIGKIWRGENWKHLPRP